jgi:hypothetical protein
MNQKERRNVFLIALGISLLAAAVLMNEEAREAARGNRPGHGNDYYSRLESRFVRRRNAGRPRHRPVGGRLRRRRERRHAPLRHELPLVPRRRVAGLAAKKKTASPLGRRSSFESYLAFVMRDIRDLRRAAVFALMTPRFAALSIAA